MQERELNLRELWKIIWKWKKFIFITVLILTLISIGVSLLLPKWYAATAIILAPETSDTSMNPMSILSDLGMGSMLGGGESVFRYLAILKSRSLREHVIQRFNLQERYKCEYRSQALKKLDKNLNFEVGDEYQITISLFDKDQDQVADITNYIVHCLDSMNIQLATSNARNNRIFMEGRVQDVMDSLEMIGQDLSAFMKENGIISLEDQVSVGVSQAAMLKAQVIEKEVEMEVAEKTFGKTNPAIHQIRFELESLRGKYTEYIHSNALENLIPNFNDIPDLEIKLIKMQRQVDYYTTVLQYLGPQYEQQKFEEAKDIPTLQILDYAVRPELKAKPKRSIIVILVFLLSGIAATTYAIMKETAYRENLI